MSVCVDIDNLKLKGKLLETSGQSVGIQTPVSQVSNSESSPFYT